MSFVALATERFEEVCGFYGETLGFAVLREWDRPDGRGRVFDLAGLQLEILDADREERPLELEPPRDRFHVVVEVQDLDALRDALPVDAPAPEDTSWGARLFRLRDPDGVAVTFLEWV